MHEHIYQKLLAVARSQRVTTYQEIAPLAGLDMSNQADRNEIGRLLGEISTVEHQLGHPLLSAVVILKEHNIPGDGFFTLARELHVHDGNDDFLFFIQELRRVHDFWHNQ